MTELLGVTRNRRSLSPMLRARSMSRSCVLGQIRRPVFQIRRKNRARSADGALFCARLREPLPFLP